jgi:hypothetical protein
VKRVWVVYALTDPRDSTRRYVGRTLEGSRRLQAHASVWRSPHEPGLARKAWLADLHASGSWPFGVEVLERVTTFRAARAAETKWLQRGFAEGWPLTNRQKKSGGGGLPPQIRLRQCIRDLYARIRVLEEENTALRAAMSGHGVAA